MTTRLIEEPDDRVQHSEVQETDAHTALTRGMADYLSALVFPGVDGRAVRFERVVEDHADPEEGARYPAAAVYAPGTEAPYDASRLTPRAGRGLRVDGRLGSPAVVLVNTSALRLMFEIAIFATDREERIAICRGLEAALSPVDWMYGCRLELGHYFNARATYEPAGIRYDDDSDAANRGWRRATIRVQGELGVYRLASYPLVRPRVAVSVT